MLWTLFQIAALMQYQKVRMSNGHEFYDDNWHELNPEDPVACTGINGGGGFAGVNAGIRSRARRRPRALWRSGRPPHSQGKDQCQWCHGARSRARDRISGTASSAVLSKNVSLWGWAPVVPAGAFEFGSSARVPPSVRVRCQTWTFS